MDASLLDNHPALQVIREGESSDHEEADELQVGLVVLFQEVNCI